MNKIKIELKWALIFVVMTFVWMYLEKILGFHSQHIDKHPIFTNFIAIPAILIYVFALRDKRNNFYNGVFTYKQGVVTGLIMTLIITLISPFTQFITSVLITPEFFPNMIKYSVEKAYLTQEAAEKYFSLNNYMQQALIGSAAMGAITTFIVAILARRTAK